MGAYPQPEHDGAQLQPAEAGSSEELRGANPETRRELIIGVAKFAGFFSLVAAGYVRLETFGIISPFA